MKKVHRDPIKRMSRRQLKKIEKTEKLLWEKEKDLLDKLREIREPIKKLRSLKRRARYWIGKRKAEKCPVFRKDNTHWDPVSCPLETPGYSTTYHTLFEISCFYCTRSKKEAMKEAVLEGIFRRY